jgi:trimeric autotransporter adhesin
MSAYNIYTENGMSLVSTHESNHKTHFESSISRSNSVNATTTTNTIDNKLNLDEVKTFAASNEAPTLMEKYFESLNNNKNNTNNTKHKKDETKKTLEFNAQRKKVSSTGSSLTSSPTSTSSLESPPHHDHHHHLEYDKKTPITSNKPSSSMTVSSSVASTPREAKPPETPRDSKSAGSTFRRNLLKFSHSKSFNPNEATSNLVVAQSVDSNSYHRKTSEPTTLTTATTKTNLGLHHTTNEAEPPRGSLDLGSSRSMNRQNHMNSTTNSGSMFVLNNKKKLQPIESRNEPSTSRKETSTSGGGGGATLVVKNQPLTPLTSGRAASLNKLEKLALSNDQPSSSRKASNNLRKYVIYFLEIFHFSIIGFKKSRFRA